MPRPAHRAGRHPPGAHAAAVAASRRLHCGARPRVVPHNSLRAKPCGPGAALEQLRQVRSRGALARADPGAVLLVAAQIAPGGCRPTRRRCCRLRAGKPSERCREDGAGQAAMRLWGAEKRSEPGRARSALRELTWRVCPSAARQRVASCAPGQAREHRRAVGAADRSSEASRPVPQRLRRHGSAERVADAQCQQSAVNRRRPPDRALTASGSGQRTKRQTLP